MPAWRRCAPEGQDPAERVCSAACWGSKSDTKKPLGMFLALEDWNAIPKEHKGVFRCPEDVAKPCVVASFVVVLDASNSSLSLYKATNLQ